MAADLECDAGGITKNTLGTDQSDVSKGKVDNCRKSSLCNRHVLMGVAEKGKESHGELKSRLDQTDELRKQEDHSGDVSCCKGALERRLKNTEYATQLRRADQREQPMAVRGMVSA